ncbi:hypothetical protein WAK64_19625 [Bacillus spongiae]|uniref:Chromosome partitioning protein ParB n=1 Tax=Bacillus spongiae TaxID=2683610 RepID=A0ABU8HIQ4_9BACI
MKRFHFPDKIEFEDILPANYSDWGNDALLFRVNRGNGKLTTRFGSDKSGKSHSFLLLEDKPLINSYGDELHCPTCAKLLSIGLGRENINNSVIHSIKHSQEVGRDISTIFNNVKPMLSILEDGYYFLTRIEMIPTDGQGNFFWNLTSRKEYYHATVDYLYYKFHHRSVTPKFILPSQSKSCYNEKRVKHYINQIEKGKSMTGLAYYYDGFMSTLLDGHHRATAAYIKNKSIDCLTIIKVSNYGINPQNKPDELYAGGRWYASNLFKKPERIFNYLKKIHDNQNAELKDTEVERILRDCEDVWKLEEVEGSSIDFDSIKSHYPDYLSIALSDLVEDVSDSHINNLLSRYDDEAELKLEMILKKFQRDDPERAFELSKKIIKDMNWKVLFEDAFRCLASFDRTEVEDIFINYLIDTELDKKDVCRKIADEYLNNR